jgi:hypothetical protein
MSEVRIGRGTIKLTPDTWDSAISQIIAVATSEIMQGVRKSDTFSKKADALRSNISGLARTVYDQLSADERSELVAHIRATGGSEEFDRLRNEAYSMVGKMVTSGQGGETGEKLFDDMLESSLDPIAQQREELIWHLYTAISGRFVESIKAVKERSPDTQANRQSAG